MTARTTFTVDPFVWNMNRASEHLAAVASCIVDRKDVSMELRMAVEAVVKEVDRLRKLAMDVDLGLLDQ